jgi:hypothetical protein
MMQPISFKTAPSVLGFEINTRSIKISKTLKYEQEGEIVVLDVRGLIYHEDFHFTSCIIGTSGIVWYRDGRVKMIEILLYFTLPHGSSWTPCKSLWTPPELLVDSLWTPPGLLIKLLF